MRYAISDIHGCNRTLVALLSKLNLSKKDTVIFLGDYIDRGNNSYAVLNTITCLNCKTIHLLGNHEQMAIFSYENPKDYLELWYSNGGTKTCTSMPSLFDFKKWIKWMKSLPYYHEEKGYFLVHAGFTHGENPFDEDAMLWSRFPSPDMGKPIINGHTPTKLNNIKINDKGNITIDGGCVFSHKEGLGNLIAFCLDTKEIIVQKNIE
jgi:serine/threonine protein phosphatase 1